MSPAARDLGRIHAVRRWNLGRSGIRATIGRRRVEIRLPAGQGIRIEPIAWRGAVAHINLMRSGEQSGMRM